MVERLGRTRLVLLALTALAVTIIGVTSGAGAIEAMLIVAGSSGPTTAAVVAAVALVLGGQALRAARTRILINQGYRSGLSPHLGALAIGYFFNAAFPLRLGEFIRAWLLARKLRISFLYTIVAVVLERLLDVVVVSGVLLVGTAMGSRLPEPVLVGAAVSIGVAIAALLLFGIVVTDRSGARWLIGLLTSWLAEPIKRRLQYSVWSVVYGSQRFFGQPRQVLAYLALLLASWVCLFGATGMLLATFVPNTPPADIVAGAVGPFVVASTSLGFTNAPEFATTVVTLLGDATTSTVEYGTIVWFVLVVPVAAIGFVWVFFYSVRSIRQSPGAVSAELPDPANKLERVTPGFNKLPEFVGAWFEGGALMRVLHQLEVKGNLALVHVFKGGSNAVTVLSRSDDSDRVMKVVPIAEKSKLRMQYDWLLEFDGESRIVRPLAEDTGDDYYSIAIEYRPTTRRLFEVIHERPISEAVRHIDGIWAYLRDRVYGPGSLVSRPDLRDAYVTDRLLDRITAAAAALPDLQRALDAEWVHVNGVRLPGFWAIVDQIRSHPKAWDELATFTVTAHVHGDLTIDNILVDDATDDFLLIDPSDDNQMRGPLIDAARMMQSLVYGYEFLNDDHTPVPVVNLAPGTVSIDYADMRSSAYACLADHVQQRAITSVLTPAEQRSVLFHVGLFYGRMLSHRVVIDSGNAAKYFAVSVRALNDYLAQFEKEESS